MFLLPFAVGALLVVVSVLSLAGGNGHGTHGHGVSHGHSISHGHGAHHGATTSHGHGHHQHHGNNAETEGKAKADSASLPMVLWLQNALLCWGACGYGANLWWGVDEFHRPSVFIAALLGGVLTLLSGRALQKMAPVGGTSVLTRRELEGCAGEAISPIASNAGAAFVRDGNGTLHQVSCRSDIRIERGARVLLIEWDEETDCYRVKPWTPNNLLDAPQSTAGALQSTAGREESAKDDR